MGTIRPALTRPYLQTERLPIRKPSARLTSDPQAAEESLRKLARYDIEAVICYHGGLYERNASRRIAEL